MRLGVSQPSGSQFTASKFGSAADDAAGSPRQVANAAGHDRALPAICFIKLHDEPAPPKVAAGGRVAANRRQFGNEWTAERVDFVRTRGLREPMRPGRVLIAGAGIGGMALAAALQRLGIQVVVLERAPRLGEVGAGLGILPKAVRALAAIGV